MRPGRQWRSPAARDQTRAGADRAARGRPPSPRPSGATHRSSRPPTTAASRRTIPGGATGRGRTVAIARPSEPARPSRIPVGKRSEGRRAGRADPTQNVVRLPGGTPYAGAGHLQPAPVPVGRSEAHADRLGDVAGTFTGLLEHVPQ